MALKNAGVLTGLMYLVAAAMDLAPCALGSGDSAAFALLSGIDPLVEPYIADFALGSKSTSHEFPGTGAQQEGHRMNPGAGRRSPPSYGRLVTAVWSDPDAELLLEQDPRTLLAQYGMVLPEAVSIEVIRNTSDAEYTLDNIVAGWENAEDTGRFALVVPATDIDDDGELAEHELDTIVAGLGPSACCSPCCCASSDGPRRAQRRRAAVRGARNDSRSKRPRPGRLVPPGRAVADDAIRRAFARRPAVTVRVRALRSAHSQSPSGFTSRKTGRLSRTRKSNAP